MSRASLCALVLVVGLATGAFSAEEPAWLKDSRARAAESGYGLLDAQGIADAVARSEATGGEIPLIVDVRPDYEFLQGHLPAAHNLEFDLGDEQSLSDAKREAVRGLLGPDLQREIIIYCRSFR